jgi:hypothetical protein
VHILKVIIRDKDGEALRNLLSCGLSPNASNKYGESLLLKVCKSGQDKLLQVFLECDVNVQVSDGAGRTPLHHACWKSSRPSFETFELILKQDPSMIFLKDHTGAAPLSYVRKGQHVAWNGYLKSIMDVYFKPLKGEKHELSPLMFLPPNTYPIVDPENALPIKLAKMVASGRMDPDVAMIANDSNEHGGIDWDDESSLASTSSHHWDEKTFESQGSESALGTSEYGDDDENDDLIFEFDGLDRLADLESRMGIKQKQGQAATSAARTTTL